MVENYGIAASYLGRAIHPPIQPGDKNWRDYLSFGGRKRGLDVLNLPDPYHNGGIWPVVGGFYVASLW